MRSKNPYLCNQFLGVLSAGRRVAEKIPAEPDQGNACAGKVISSYLHSSPFAALRLVASNQTNYEENYTCFWPFGCCCESLCAKCAKTQGFFKVVFAAGGSSCPARRGKGAFYQDRH